MSESEVSALKNTMPLVSLVDIQAGRALEVAVIRCRTSLARRDNEELKALVASVLDAKRVHLRDETLRKVEARWWHTVPIPEGTERIALEFRDVTPQYKSYRVTEVWPPETVECALYEPFENAAHRFRVQANKKHSHPFWPSQHFDAVLKKEEQAPLSKLGPRTVAEVLQDLSEDHVVSYVRNDEDNVPEHLHSPARHFNLWDIILPAWCVTPDHWFEPIPPPSFLEQSDTPPAPGKPYYKRLPILFMSGCGRHIVPSATKPDLITRSFFFPVEDGPDHTVGYYVDPAGDLIPRSGQLAPGEITLDEARALLGRVVQSSTEPRSDPDAPPAAKRRKVNYDAYTVGFAWGLELDANGGPAWLHCIKWGGGPWGTIEYVLDLSGQNRRAYDEDEGSPLARWIIPCAWVGIPVLPMDQKKTSEEKVAAGDERAPQVGEAVNQKPTMSLDEWSARTDKWIRDLNKKKFASVVEVRHAPIQSTLSAADSRII